MKSRILKSIVSLLILTSFFAMMIGCATNRKEVRQETRTEKRVEDRYENRHD